MFDYEGCLKTKKEQQREGGILHDNLRCQRIDLLQLTTLLLAESGIRGNDLRQKQKFYRNIIGVAVYMLILFCCVHFYLTLPL